MLLYLSSVIFVQYENVIYSILQYLGVIALEALKTVANIPIST
jgi:hypothetical protein